MVLARAEKAAHHLNAKDICGYDNRLGLNASEFAKWSATQEGETALESGVLGPRTAETMGIGAHSPLLGPEAPDVPDVLKNICTRTAKKCARHQGWSVIHREAFASAPLSCLRSGTSLWISRLPLLKKQRACELWRPEARRMPPSAS